MAQYHQQPQATNYLPIPVSNGRGGSKNAGRGSGKRGRGGRVSGHDDFNRYSNFGVPYGNYNQGQPVGPGVPPAVVYHTGPPTAATWQLPYGGHAIPYGSIGYNTVPYSSTTNSAGLIGTDPRSPSIGSAMPQRTFNHTFTPTNLTPIINPPSQTVTPNSHIATVSDITTGKVLPVAPIMTDVHQQSAENPNTVPASDPFDAGGNMRANAPTFMPLQIPIVLHNTADTSDRVLALPTAMPLLKAAESNQSNAAAPVSIAISEGLNLTGNLEKPNEVIHKSTEEIVELLGHKTFSSLQELDNTQTAGLSKQLREALKAHRTKQTSVAHMQNQVHAKLMRAYANEDICEGNAVNLYGQFVHQMSRAIKSDNEDAKKTLQHEAIKSIQMARQQSELAMKYSKKVEQGRRDFLALDRNLVVLSEEFANTVYDAVFIALRRADLATSLDFPRTRTGRPENTKEDPTKAGELSKIVQETGEGTQSEKKDQLQGATMLPVPPQQMNSPSDSEYNLGLKSTHKSINEQHWGTIDAEKQAGLKELVRMTQTEPACVVDEQSNTGPTKKTEIAQTGSDAAKENDSTPEATSTQETEKDVVNTDTHPTVAKCQGGDTSTKQLNAQDHTDNKTARQDPKPRKKQTKRKYHKKYPGLDAIVNTAAKDKSVVSNSGDVKPDE
ncbi:hypothetical protein BKA66DRAFT_447345 [Pyrenochaeta sp. MPI-SDFR-AT-0127]|nr:hypothetical protein BKA66DRAFT_447345 [Pyrenochaeta sp. MPI-SDFR-AT-0127]